MNIYTPWGLADDVKEIAPGITSVGTPSHGGFRLSAGRQTSMPHAFRKGEWYEEDCEWSLVVLSFPEAFPASLVEEAHKSAKDWFPDEYEAWTGQPLDPNESLTLRKRRDRETYKDAWVVTSAFGDWHENVPQGMVGCYAGRGGSREGTSESRWFLVPATEYNQLATEIGFIIDPARHPEVDPIQ